MVKGKIGPIARGAAATGRACQSSRGCGAARAGCRLVEHAISPRLPYGTERGPGGGGTVPPGMLAPPPASRRSALRSRLAARPLSSGPRGRDGGRTQRSAHIVFVPLGDVSRKVEAARIMERHRTFTPGDAKLKRFSR